MFVKVLHKFVKKGETEDVINKVEFEKKQKKKE